MISVPPPRNIIKEFAESRCESQGWRVATSEVSVSHVVLSRNLRMVPCTVV